ncbi:MAG TPA: CocE/NonD family hydrolase, partial [Nitriliruptorales bacterium]
MSSPPIRQLWDVSVPMRDGVRTSADVHFPEGGPDGGPYPTLLYRNCYNAQMADEQAAWFAARGYAVVLQDVRGRNDSDGFFVPIIQEVEDGYDSVEWAAGQPWSTGKVGMFGASYMGWTQLAAIKSQPPSLVTACPSVPAGRLQKLEIWNNGILMLPTIQWHNFTGGKSLQYNTTVDWRRVMWHLPLRTMDTDALGRDMPNWRDWIDHPGRDGYWKPSIFTDEDFAAIDIPILHLGGWWDGNRNTSIWFYEGARDHAASADQQFLLMGPWLHSTIGAGRNVGPFDFGDEAIVDVMQLQLEWFDHWLKGQDNGITERFGPARTFVTGVNEWRSQPQWPPVSLRPEPFFLHSEGDAATVGGQLTLDKPADEPADVYRYDPADPVIIMGGDWNGYPFSFAEGLQVAERYARQAAQQADDDVHDPRERADVLLFETDPLEAPVELQGWGEAILWAASDGPDTDWFVDVADVDPDGQRLPLSSG